MRFGNLWPLHNLIITLALSIFMAYIILYQIQCPSSADFMKIPGFEKIGKYTYGLYLCYTFCIFYAYSLERKIQTYDCLDFYYMYMFFRPLVSLTVTLLVSCLSNHFCENYFLNLKTKFQSI